MLVATAQQAVRGLSDDTTLSALPMLVGPAYWLVPLGFLALTVLMLIDLARASAAVGRMLFSQEAPPAWR